MLHRGGGPFFATRLALAATVLHTMVTASRSSSFLDMVDPFWWGAAAIATTSPANLRWSAGAVNGLERTSLSLKPCYGSGRLRFLLGQPLEPRILPQRIER